MLHIIPFVFLFKRTCIRVYYQHHLCCRQGVHMYDQSNARRQRNFYFFVGSARKGAIHWWLFMMYIFSRNVLKCTYIYLFLYTVHLFSFLLPGKLGTSFHFISFLPSFLSSWCCHPTGYTVQQITLVKNPEPPKPPSPADTVDASSTLSTGALALVVSLFAMARLR